jgi:hypothetical protein
MQCMLLPRSELHCGVQPLALAAIICVSSTALLLLTLLTTCVCRICCRYAMRVFACRVTR